jgi:hypothetical protein
MPICSSSADALRLNPGMRFMRNKMMQVPKKE